MSKISITIWTFFLILLLTLTLVYLWQIGGILLFPKHITISRQLSLYQWAALGFVLYVVFHRLVDKNISFLEVMSHEWTHIIVAMLFLRRIHSFHAEERSGVVYTSGNRISDVPMTLAPYCLPIVTYLLLALRCLISSQGLMVFDILIGISISFHFFCFQSQTSSRQPDIRSYPIAFSYLYIWTARLMNLAIILVAFFPGYNVFTSIGRYFTTAFDNISTFVSMIS